VKKTPLMQYSRPLKGGIIAIKLREDDELVDVVVTQKGDEVVLSTKQGMAIRFNESDARPMGRNTSGVKGISLSTADELVGMVVADPEATLLTVCENGYGKRTTFGPNSPSTGAPADDGTVTDEGAIDGANVESSAIEQESESPEPAEGEEADGANSSHRYRTQRRGGKGLRDIKTTDRNGPVVGVVSVSAEDELLMMTARGKIQRIVAGEVSSIGRNTQGVRIMSLDDEDMLAAVVRVPREEGTDETDAAAGPEQVGPEQAGPETTAEPPV
jgi:DNA gyrase subunit A